MKHVRSPLVFNCERDEFDVYVGRDSPFGNPFRIGPAQNRTQVIERFRKWVRGQPELLDRIRKELRGKRLGCWCRPKNCHADVLAEIANAD